MHVMPTTALATDPRRPKNLIPNLPLAGGWPESTPAGFAAFYPISMGAQQAKRRAWSWLSSLPPPVVSARRNSNPQNAPEQVEASAGQHDEFGVAAGLAAEALVGDDQRGAGDQQLADPLGRLRRDLNAAERLRRGWRPRIDERLREGLAA